MVGLMTSEAHQVVAADLDPGGVLNEKGSWTNTTAETHIREVSSALQQSELTEPSGPFQ